MLTELDESLSSLSARVLIVESSVDRVFCAGADLKERAQMNEREVSEFVTNLRSTFARLEKLEIPTIAVINGVALGGGLELALCCDFRYASETSVLGLPETSLAIIPGAGGTQRLPRLIGASKAKELIFTARKLSGNEAFDYGLVNGVSTDPKQLALNLARQILPNGPKAVQMAKNAIDYGLEQPIEGGLFVEKSCYAQIIPTEDRLEGLRAFREKRKPVYSGK
jgi:methylglutaconyl-CoA hydratase